MKNMDAESWVKNGDESFEAKKYEDAAIYYKNATQLNPNCAPIFCKWGNALYLLAEAKKDLSLLEEAAQKYECATQLSPNDDSLFYSCGNIFYKLANIEQNMAMYEKAIEKYDMAIALNPKNTDAFNHCGLALYGLAEIKQDETLFERAIRIFDCSTQIDPTNYSAFNNCGNALHRLAEIKQDVSLFEIAIEKYNKAITLNPNDASAFYNCGLTFCRLAEIKQCETILENAIEKYEISIKLDPTYASAFCNCGIALYRLANMKNDVSLFERAFDNYDKATQLYQSNTNRATAFNGWGVALECLAKIKKDISLFECAIEKYQKAILLDPNNLAISSNWELAQYRLAKFKTDLSNANTLHNEETLYSAIDQIKIVKEFFIPRKMNLLEILTFLCKENKEKLIKTEIFHSLLDSDNNDGIFFKETTNNLTPEEQKNLDKYKKIYILSVFIISLLHINNRIESLVAHYCEKNISQTLLFDNKSKFRLNAIDYSKDPFEGKTLLDFIYGEKKYSSDKKLNTVYEAFAGCFTFDCDNLNLFRLYGKEAGKEGTGLSLVFLDSFFSMEAKMIVEPPQIDSLQMTVGSPKKDSIKIETDTPIEQDKLSLFRCIYIDPHPETKQPIVTVGQKEEHLFYRESIGDMFEDYSKKTNDIVKSVREKMAELKELANELDPTVVGQLLLNLRYLVKHVAFKEEQECRIVKIHPLIDKNGKIKNDFKRLYIEYSPKVSSHVDKIYFGPKVTGIELFRNMLKNKNITDISCEQSKNPLA